MTTKARVLLLSVSTMAVWGVAGGSFAFVFGMRPEHAVTAWLLGMACGALHSVRLIVEFKVNGPVFTPRDIPKAGDL